MIPACFSAKLASRGVVQVSGPDSLRFLQALVTNDLHSICSPAAPSSLSAFLNGRGRLLFSALMHRADESRYLLDLPSDRCAALVKHLRQYRLRAKVDVADVSGEHSVWAVLGADTGDFGERKEARVVCDDPRLAALGKRAVMEGGFEGFGSVPMVGEEEYTRVRVLLGVPDDTDFLDTPLPLDLALHLLNGVSFTKGCYLGQELTARSHFTGVLRKRITPLAITDGPAAMSAAAEGFDPATLLSDDEGLALRRGTQVFVDGKKKAAGTVTSSVNNIGLAVVRLDDVFPPGILSLADGRTAYAWQPGWWGERGGDAVPAEE